MTIKRLFLALVLPQAIKENIDQWRQAALSSIDSKPIPLDNYHITLVFLGDTNPDKARQLHHRLTQIKDKVVGNPVDLHAVDLCPFDLCSFDLCIDHTAYWPKPRLIYLAPLVVPPALTRLQQSLNQIVDELGLPTENRPYQPHISLYRKITPARFEQLQHSGLPQPNQPMTITHFALYQSISRPGGVVYEVVERYSL